MSDRVGRAVRAVMAGLHIVIAMVPAACQPSPGEPCGDGYCSANTQCMTVSINGEAAKPTCIVPGTCGNGVPDPGEQCEDGNNKDGDGCEADCTLPKCGNGVVDPGEDCDGRDVGGYHCSPQCKLEVCGNGVLDPGEQCDGQAGPQPCSTSCRQEICGNGILDKDAANAISEECDDKNTMNDDGCSSDCKYEFCGDGVKNFHEQCDPTDPIYGPSLCNVDCTLSSCGDGEVNPFADPPEQCDLGTVNGVNLNQDHAACTSRCQINVCGDGKLLLGVEECDDGAANGTAGSGCDSFCKNNLCGNGIVDVGAGEECDPGGGPHPADTATCTSTCHIPRCGDGEVNGLFKPDEMHGEMCDEIDANGASLNGVPCDYGNPFCSRCNATCTGRVSPGGPFCGDGIQQADFQEQCDPATGPSTTNPSDPPSPLAKADSATCDRDCTPVMCGDGYVNTVALETCDDGNQSVCGTCPAPDCKNAAAISAVRATSTITTTDGGQIDNEDTLTLDDGFGTRVTFEFILSGTSPGGTHVAITFAQDPATDAATIASRLVDAINNHAPAGFLITAGVQTGDTTVLLTNRRKSSFGNTPIEVTGKIGITGTGFTFSASPPMMTGGAAGDCLAGIGCASPDDCESGVCSSGKCQCTADSQCPASTTCNMSTGNCH